MQILGVDYGRSKVGLAIAGESGIAEPLYVFKVKSSSEVLDKLENLVRKGDIKKVVLGNPGGNMGQEIKKFADLLHKKTSLPVEVVDETLSTNQAIRLSIEAGIKRKKRKSMEDAYAAAIILQSFLDKS